MKTQTAADLRWRDAAFILPRAEHFPVEVQLDNGKTETRKKMEGDWRNVRRWRIII